MLTKTNLMTKKISITIITIAGLYLLTACNGFDAAWYQQQQTKVAGPKEDNFKFNSVDASKDPFLKAENNNPNANGFSNQVFDTWLLTAKFDDKNVPIYKFDTNPSANWSLKKGDNKTIDEYSYLGANSSAGSNSITDMKYFLYKRANPLYLANSNYNQAPHAARLERFYFYRHTGKGGGIAGLNNYLVAIDSYSKLVYAYAVPTQTTNVLGNVMPTQWGPVDEHTIVNGAKYNFYEFNPVGIVKADGSVEVYQWFKDNMAKANYHPIMGDMSQEVATYGKAGRSPYKAEEVALSKIKGKLSVKLVSLENVDFYDGGDATSQFMYEFTSTFIDGAVDEKNKKIDVLGKNKGLIDAWSIIPTESTYIGVGQIHNFTNPKKEPELTYEIDSQRKVFVDLNLDIRENDYFFKVEQIIAPNKPTISLIYDRNKKAWTLDKSKSLDSLQGTTLELDEEFSLSTQDSTKNLTLTIKRDKASKDQKFQGSLKITYALKWIE